MKCVAVLVVVVVVITGPVYLYMEFPEEQLQAFIFHNITDLHMRYSVPESITFGDDASVMISSANFDDFITLSNVVMFYIIKWTTSWP
jgi:hypothetical protein